MELVEVWHRYLIGKMEDVILCRPQISKYLEYRGPIYDSARQMFERYIFTIISML